jgi:hypothetical protein
MRSFTLALILASAAVVPTFAQEVEIAPVEAVSVQAEAPAPPRYFEQKQSQGERAIEMARRDGGERRSERMSDIVREPIQQQRQPEAQPMPSPQPVAQPSRDWGGGNWNGGGRGRDAGSQQPQSIPQPMPQPVQQQTWQRNQGGWDRGGNARPVEQQGDGGRRWNRDGDRDRGDGGNRSNGDWRGRGEGDIQRPVPPIVQPQPQQGGGWDRNRGGQGDQGWDRNRGGHGDRDWDRNRNDRNSGWNRDRDRDHDRDRDRRYENGRDNSQFGWRNNNRGWDQRWRNDQRYDWRGHRNQYQNRYRINRYYNPYGYGYGYQRFGIGIYLDQPFFGRSYWISDPWQYRLPTAPYGYRWVRYYNDVLLVDLRTGFVEDVIYNFFW